MARGLSAKKGSRLPNSIDVHTGFWKNICSWFWEYCFAFIVLFFSSRFFITYAKNLTELLGVAESTIGITVVAFGTSLPEVVATIIAIVKKQNNLAVGNILGSNIANIFGITLIAIFLNGQINYYELLSSIDKWLFLLVSLVFFIMIVKKMAGKLLSIGLIFAYLAYFTYLYI